MRLSMQGWELEIAPASKAVPAGAHELSHVTQQRAGVRAWGKYSISKLPGRPKAPGVPEIDDEVLVAFESGDVRHATLYFSPTEITALRPTAWKTELGPVNQTTFRVRVIRSGLGRLGMAVRTSLDAAGMRNPTWVRIL